MNLGIGLGGFTGGLIANADSPTSFTVLFLLDAADVPRLRRRALVRPRSRHAGAREGESAGVLPRGAARPAVPRSLDAELPLRRRGLLAVQPRCLRSHATTRTSASGRSASSSSSTRRDRARAAADLTLARRDAPHARARADAGPLGRRVAAASTPTGVLARRDGRVRRDHRRARDLRDRRVLPRAGAPGARRRDRTRPPARPLLRACTRSRGGSPARSGRRSAASSSRGGRSRSGRSRRRSASSPPSGALALERFVPERNRRIPRGEPDVPVVAASPSRGLSGKPG